MILLRYPHRYGDAPEHHVRTVEYDNTDAAIRQGFRWLQTTNIASFVVLHDEAVVVAVRRDGLRDRLRDDRLGDAA